MIHKHIIFFANMTLLLFSATAIATPWWGKHQTHDDSHLLGYGVKLNS